MINIKYFARLSENLESKGEVIEFGEQSKTVDAVIQLLVDRGEPWITEFSAETKVLVAVNYEICQTDTQLKEGDEVAFFPPVTGG
ncbi:MAG: molybdopterin converting factor subunit 1 [Gammaproteobacteria bacterium]|nr:MAG: molybdopterin converting factor subunit 1 [Gammaproteobacteria bacterium]